MSSFSIRNFLNRAARAPSAQTVSTQGGSAGASVGAASGPSSTTPRAAYTSSSLYEGIWPHFPLIPCHDIVEKGAAVKEVCDFLSDVNVGIVGIYGMGGVGKTALMKTVHNEFLFGCDFDFIFWVVVSKEWNYERIRKAIIRKIPESGLDEGVDAMELYNFLLNKRFVLLLDDVWEHLDLMELGVPVPTETNKCKIIFTTRSEEICQQMRADRVMKVDCLGPTDSWALFEKNVGEKALKTHPRLAHQVMKECCGLPLALITVGRAMSSKYTPQEWEHALDILENNPYQMPGVEKKVFSCLEFSYQSLEEDTSRKCFLYCSLFPEDFSIGKEKLVDYWIGEGFLGKCENLKQLRNRGYHIIGVLLSACLIENGTDEEGKEAVKMHDVIRDMALWIVSDHGFKQNSFFVHPGHRLTSSEINDRWNTAERIFVRDLAELPRLLSCPVLTTLIFYKDVDLVMTRNRYVVSGKTIKLGIGEKEKQIKGKAPAGPSSDPDLGPHPRPGITEGMEIPFNDAVMSTLFQFMPILRLLDLSFHLLSGLPKAIMKLSKLRYLSSAGLKYFSPEVGKLLSVEILNMSCLNYPTENSSLLVDLPETIGLLLALRILRLKGIWIKSVPPEIGLLSNLEILDLSNTPIFELPTEVQNLRELRQLILTGTMLRSFPVGVINLFKLEVLDLSKTKIWELPLDIYVLRELRSLNLESTLLSNLPVEVFKLLKLEVLNISNSNLTMLPTMTELHSNSNITMLPTRTELGWRDLNLFALKNSFVKILKDLLFEVTKLEILDLSFTSIAILPSLIFQLVELRHLNLQRTLICRLPEDVKSLTKLEVLNLNSTLIEELPKSINQLQQLRELRLYNTRIQRLPKQVGELSKLNILSINDTSINLPDCIYLLPKLRVVMFDPDPPGSSQID